MQNEEQRFIELELDMANYLQLMIEVLNHKPQTPIRDIKLDALKEAVNALMEEQIYFREE